jgi:import inner membrane translocase subunit TIM16
MCLLALNGWLTCFLASQQFDKYFAANAVGRGGSFYLQSKVYRAKQLMDEYLADKENEASESSNEEVDEKQEQDKKSS